MFVFTLTEIKTGDSTGGKGRTEVDRLERQAGFQAVGVEVGGEGRGVGQGGLADPGEAVRGDGQGAAGKEPGKFGDRMNGGRPL
jgi:hypothetical protein